MKKFVFFLLAVGLAFVLVGCGSDDEVVACDAHEDALYEKEDEYDDDTSFFSPRTDVVGILEATQLDFVMITAYSSPYWSEELEELVWGDSVNLNKEDAQKLYDILSTMDAVEVLTPTHFESWQADVSLKITIHYSDDSTVDVLLSQGSFIRFTNTFGSHNDPGFVFGQNEELLELLLSKF